MLVAKSNINIYYIYSSFVCIVYFLEFPFPHFSQHFVFAQIPIGNCGETSNRGPVSIELHLLFDQYTASRNSVPNGPRDQTILDLCQQNAGGFSWFLGGFSGEKKKLYTSFHPISLICEKSTKNTILQM